MTYAQLSFWRLFANLRNLVQAQFIQVSSLSIIQYYDLTFAVPSFASSIKPFVRSANAFYRRLSHYLFVTTSFDMPPIVDDR